jgi:hypothetical protein
MRLPDRPAERGALDERGGTGQARGAADELRQRLDRLAACHPSSPDYEACHPSSPDHEETGYAGLAESGEMERGETPEYGDYQKTENEAAGAGGERAADEQDRQAARPGGREGELAGREGNGRADRPGAGRPAGWRAGDAERQLDEGAAGGLGGGREPYRPWFTAGESPEPWFTSDSGG